jgi:hypothetical protein
MNVVVQCFHCNAILELDEGFRGGVCRCSNCGSLLQVPKADGPVSKGKKVRPAVPPAARSASATAPGQGAATQAAAKGDSSVLHSPLDPRRASYDAGGSSSGLGRIHKTEPVAPATSTTKRIVPSILSTTLPQARGLPQLRALRRNKTLFWSGVLLLILVTAAVVGLLAYYLYR